MKKHFYLVSFEVTYTYICSKDKRRSEKYILAAQVAFDKSTFTAKDLVTISSTLAEEFVKAVPEADRQIQNFTLIAISPLGEMEPEEFANLPESN